MNVASIAPAGPDCANADREQDVLIDRAVAGDQAALQRLLMAHHARLASEMFHKFPRRFRGVLSVDDVLQDAYIVAFREIRSFRPSGARAFAHWLSKIAEHRLFDALRAESAAKRGGNRARAEAPRAAEQSSIVDWLEMLAVNERTPSQSVAGREALAAVRSALMQLKEGYREAIRLRYVDGLRVSEAAARMNRTEGAVCLLCYRGLRKLQQVLGSSAAFFESRG